MHEVERRARAARPRCGLAQTSAAALALIVAAAAFGGGCGTEGRCLPNADAPPGADACAPIDFSTPDGRDADEATGDDASNPGNADGSADDGAYPAGPYGTAERDTIAPLVFNDSAGAPWGLAAQFDDPDAKLLLLSTGAGWCTACREEQPTLVELHDEHAADGLRVVVALFEDDSARPVTAAYADAWRRRYALPFPVLVDDANQMGGFYDSNLAPMNLFVDLRTMTILRASIGFDETATRAIIRDRLR